MLSIPSTATKSHGNILQIVGIFHENNNTNKTMQWKGMDYVTSLEMSKSPFFNKNIWMTKSARRKVSIFCGVCDMCYIYRF